MTKNQRSSPHTLAAGLAFCAGLTAMLVLTLPTLRVSVMQLMGATTSMGFSTSPGSCVLTWVDVLAGKTCTTTFVSTGTDASEASFQCDDGNDNDGDGKTDYPTDPGCTSDTDNSERDPQCMDGLNNDGYNGADYPTDPGCSSPTDDNEADKPQCSDRMDNNGNGRVDYPNDPSCTSDRDNDETGSSASTSSGAPQCDDGADNDGDGSTDFPSDTDCASAIDDSEAAQLRLGPTTKSNQSGTLCGYCLQLQDAKVQQYCTSSAFVQSTCEI